MKKSDKYQPKENSPYIVEEAAVDYIQSESKTTIEHILGVDPTHIAEPLDRINTFRNGLNKKSFDQLKKVTGLDYNKLASALDVSTKTLQRKEVFDVVQSEKMYGLAELYAIGIDYFGNEGFKRWMDRPLYSIGNLRPIDLLDVSEGISILKTEIMRVQHGIAI